MRYIKAVGALVVVVVHVGCGQEKPQPEPGLRAQPERRSGPPSREELLKSVSPEDAKKWSEFRLPSPPAVESPEARAAAAAARGERVAAEVAKNDFLRVLGYRTTSPDTYGPRPARSAPPHPGLDVRMQIDDLSGAPGQPPPDGWIATKIRAAYMGRLKACYRRALDSAPSAAGPVTVAFIIGPLGTVMRVVRYVSEIIDLDFEACIEASVRRWWFQKPSDGKPAFVSVTLSFSAPR